MIHLLSALALTACAQTQDTSPSSSAQEATSGFPALVTDRLAEAADRSAAALQTLAMIERTRLAPSPARVDEAALSPELRQPVTMGWVGPAPEAVRSIAALVGYRFVETGARPSTPTMVTIDARERAAGQLLSDIGLQVQGRGAVLVSQRARVVEYRHGGASAAPPRTASSAAPVRPASAASQPVRRASSSPAAGTSPARAPCRCD